MSGSSDIGTAVIYAMDFTGLLLFGYYQGTSRLSVDYYLEKRISWWRWIAEVGHHDRYHSRPTSTPQPVSPTVPGQHVPA